MYNKKYMQMAIVTAKCGVQCGHGGPFGAVIVKDNNILAVCHNTVVLHNDPTAHGEINAIRQACNKIQTFNLSGCELYTTSEPCPMCMVAIMWAHIDKVYFGCSVNDSEAIGFSDKKIQDYISGKENARNVVILKQHDKEECLKIFKEWENKEEKVIY